MFTFITVLCAIRVSLTCHQYPHENSAATTEATLFIQRKFFDSSARSHFDGGWVLHLTMTIMLNHFFFTSFTVQFSNPTGSTASATHFQFNFFVLSLMPEERVPNKIFHLNSTSESSISTLHSLKFLSLANLLLSFTILPEERVGQVCLYSLLY